MNTHSGKGGWGVNERAWGWAWRTLGDVRILEGDKWSLRLEV